MGTNLQKYGDFSLEQLNELDEEIQKGSGSQNFFKAETGRNVVRFMPASAPGVKPFKQTYQHYIDVPGASRSVVFTCPKRSEEKTFCPACHKSDQLARSGNPADRDAAYRMAAKLRIFANVIDRKNPDSGPLVFGFGKTIWDGLKKIRKDEDAGGNFTDPLHGFDIIIEREGAGMNTKYSVMPARKITPLGNEEWIALQHDLEAIARVRGAEEIEKLMNGEDAGPPQRRGASERPAASQPKRRTASDDIQDGEFEEKE